MSPQTAEPSASTNECDVYGKRVKRPRDLRRHRNSVHSYAAVRFCCKMAECAFWTIRKDRLSKHMQRIHGMRKAMANSEPNETNAAFLQSLQEKSSKEGFGLLSAADIGSLSLVQLQLDNGVGINTWSEEGRSALHVAAAGGHEAVVELLLAHQGIDAEWKDNDGRTPLSWAAAGGRQAVVERLLAYRGVWADWKDCSGRTPLSWAAAGGHKTVVELFWEQGVQPDSTTLDHAVKKGNLVVVELLLEIGVQPDSAALNSAAFGGNKAVMELLLEKEVRPDSTALNTATMRRDLAVVELLL